MLLFMAMIDDPDEKKQFEDIYISNRELMYRYAFRILQDEASTEDAVHDAFLSFAKNYDKYKSMDCNQTRSFLIITVRNAAFKIYNKRKRETATDDFFLGDEEVPDIAVNTELNDVKRILFDMVKSLDSKYADVIMLFYYCNLSVNQIAEQLELTPENVKVRLHRARSLLKSKLEGVGISEG